MAEVKSKDPSSVNATVIMKVDGPTEDHSTKQDMGTNKVDKSDEFKVCSPSNPFRTTNTNPFALDHNKFGKSILKPSLLTLTSSAPNNSILKESSFNPNSNISNDNKSDNSDKKQVNGEAVKFVPLIKTDAQKHKPADLIPKNNSNINTTTATPTFVFGQNLQERVLATEVNSIEPSPSTSSINSNGTSDMLFSSAIKHENKSELLKEKEIKSLTESAREYEESRANKRKYDEVQVKTGEEEETNVINISCKLFLFDKTTSNWQERGRGTLRLNDFEVDCHTGSRLVFRTSGSLRVILNTKIWAEMTIDKASEKSIRFTALDSNGEIKVFLITSSIEDSRQLYMHLQTRLEKEIVMQKRKKLEISNSGEK